MKIVLALGNPGSRYAATRHNIGWMVCDAVAAKLGIQFRPARGEYHEARGVWQNQEFLLVKPATYMNNSGIAARQVTEQHKVPLSDMLVVVDEIQFPAGRMRIKPSGSSGGHNGTESLIYHLESHDFPRLRCGIGRDFQTGGLVEYVLSPFPPHEEETVAAMIARSREVVLLWIAEGTAHAMNVCNSTAAGEPAGDSI